MKSKIKSLAIWLIILVIFIVIINSILDNTKNKLAYSELIAKIETGSVKEIEISANRAKANVKLKNENVEKEVNIPSIDNLMNVLDESMKAGTIIVSEKSESIFAFGLTLLTPIGILIAFGLFWVFMINSNQNGSNKQCLLERVKQEYLLHKIKQELHLKM